MDILQRIFTLLGTPDTEEDWKNVQALQNYHKFNKTEPKDI
jgi:hypothetical protein